MTCNILYRIFIFLNQPKTISILPLKLRYDKQQKYVITFFWSRVKYQQKFMIAYVMSFILYFDVLK